jgi:hypothetical protein
LANSISKHTITRVFGKYFQLPIYLFFSKKSNPKHIFFFSHFYITSIIFYYYSKKKNSLQKKTFSLFYKIIPNIFILHIISITFCTTIQTKILQSQMFANHARYHYYTLNYTLIDFSSTVFELYIFSSHK